MKKYQVMILDEWENLYHIGFYEQLDESIDDINNFIQTYGVSIDKLEEHVETFDTSFNKLIELEDGSCISIKGFIFD